MRHGHRLWEGMSTSEDDSGGWASDPPGSDEEAVQVGWERNVVEEQQGKTEEAELSVKQKRRLEGEHQRAMHAARQEERLRVERAQEEEARREAAQERQWWKSRGVPAGVFGGVVAVAGVVNVLEWEWQEAILVILFVAVAVGKILGRE